MAGIKIANNAWGILSATVEAGATAFPFVITTGAAFPVLGSGEWFYVLLQDADGNREIAKVTVFSSGSGVLGGISRGQEGTTARRWLSGARISLALTAQSIADYALAGSGVRAAATGVDAIAAAFTPAITALSDGVRLTVRAAATNTSVAPTFTPAPGVIAAKDIVKGYGIPLVPGDIAGAGHWLDLQYDSTIDKWVLQNPAAGIASAAAAVGSVRNLKMSIAAPSVTATLTADEVVVSAALGGSASYKIGSFNKTVTLTATGAGGMDTGAAPVSGYVALYAIYNPATRASALLAVNATGAEVPEVYGGANMPAGYTASALVSVWPTNSSGQFKPGIQRDRRVEFPSATAVATSSPPTTLTPLSLAASIPPNATFVKGRAAMYATVTATVYSLFAAGDLNGASFQGQVGYTAPGGSLEGNFEIAMATKQTIYYYTAGVVPGTTYTVYIVGYQF